MEDPSDRSAIDHASLASDTSQPRKRRRGEKINYPKRRVSVACEICRTRKTRCDARRPTCSFCRDIQAECVYRSDLQPEKSERSVEENSDSEVLTRLKRIEQLLEERGSCNRNVSHESMKPTEVLESLRPPEVFESIGLSPDNTFSSLLMVKPSYYTHRPLTIGIDLSGLSRLIDRPCPAALTPLCCDDFEEQLELQLLAGEKLMRHAPLNLSTLDLDPRRCWRFQQSFVREVLPWYPIVPGQTLAELVSRTADGNFDPYNLETSLVLFVFALGAFAQESHHLADDADAFPGIEYFRVASRLLDADKGFGNTALVVQCHIFMAVYLLYSLRPIQAFEVIRRAAVKVIMLLQLQTRMVADPKYREMCHRAFWACYLIEHELQSYVPFSGLLLQIIHNEVPLPASDYDEPGIYWFLSEAAIRRIFTRPRHGVGWNMHILYEPTIAEEIASQMLQWHANLPYPLRWPLEDTIPMRPLLDPQRSFLRAQYYYIKCVLFWQDVVRLLTKDASSSWTTQGFHNDAENARVKDSAKKSLHCAVLHVYATEPLFQHRHPMLMASFHGLYTVTMLLLCTFDVPALYDVQPAYRGEAIAIAKRSLKNLQGNGPIRKKIERIEGLMRRQGL
ncbi:hypothetical protein K491DRAFT_638362, partial [Lophiostoma macrostomum CBS 122681]